MRRNVTKTIEMIGGQRRRPKTIKNNGGKKEARLVIGSYLDLRKGNWQV